MKNIYKKAINGHKKTFEIRKKYIWMNYNWYNRC